MQAQETNQQLTLKSYFSRDEVKARFKEMLGQKAQGFITSVLQIAASNDKLKKADPISIYNSAAMAATLDLPINASLGFAYIVPYEISIPPATQGGKWEKQMVAQFQMGYKGFIQLGQRSGKFKALNATDVREGEIKRRDRLSGEIIFEWIEDEEARAKLPVVGYVSFFQLVNGFSKTFYMSNAQITKHAISYSKSYNSEKGLWKKDFESMALKTVLKLNLSKYAPMSIEMEKALRADQAVLKDEEGNEVVYPDNDTEDISHEPVDPEKARLKMLFKDAQTQQKLSEYWTHAEEYGLQNEFDARMQEIIGEK